jgi:hypothetical protein
MFDITRDTPELRKRIEAHNAEAMRLHLPPPPVVWLDFKVEAPDGTVVHEHREKSNSWVRNAYNLMAALFLPAPAITSGAYGAGCLRSKDTNGSTYNVPAGGELPGLTAGPANLSNSGIVVGTGTGEESFESTALGTIISSGTGAGQLSYQQIAIQTPSYNAETKKWTGGAVRIFNNNTANPITVTEVGWVGYSNRMYLVDRTLLGSPVEVPAAYKLTVTYTTEITFPA